MTEKRIPIFTFTQRIGNTNFTVRAYCDDDIAVTYEDKLLELIRSGVLQTDASEKPNTQRNFQNTNRSSYKEECSMASERIEKLLAMQQKAEAQKRKAEQQLKAAKHKISIQRNKERTHRLCERGGHLEHYLPNPELLTDEDVFLLIDYFFSSPRVRELVEQMTASRRGEIPQSPKELIDAARQRMPKPSVSSVTWHDTDEDDAESDGSSPIP